MLKKVLLGLLVCLMAQTTVWAVDMTPFINLLALDGAKWVYEAENGEEDELEIMSGTIVLNGIQDARKLTITSLDSSGSFLNEVDEFYKIDGRGVFELMSELYEETGCDPSTVVKYDAPFKMVIATEMGLNDPLESTGSGTLTSSSIFFAVPGLFDSNVTVLGYESLTMPYGTFETLKIAVVQSASGTVYGYTVNFDESFTIYVEPNLGVLVQEDENGTRELAGIKNVPVPGDANGDADVDGTDLAAAVSTAGDIGLLAQYFGVALPMIQ